MKNRRLLILIPLVILAVIWPFSNYVLNKKDNKTAQALYENLCEPSQLIENGDVRKWMTMYNQIVEGSFSDAAHLVTPIKQDGWDPDWPVAGTKRIVVYKYRVSFMDSNDEIVLRDPQYREMDFWPTLLTQGFLQHGCHYEKHRSLHRFLWTDRFKEKI